MENEHQWAESDFDNMEWHDCPIYSVTFSNNNELIFDIDYILKWIEPNNSDGLFSFWIAPATLCFKNVYNLKIESNIINFIIVTIYRNNPKQPKNIKYIQNDIEYDWHIETTEGEITFTSVGYNQHTRKHPILTNNQYLGLNERHQK